jgi:hypothetical protein
VAKELHAPKTDKHLDGLESVADFVLEVLTVLEEFLIGGDVPSAILEKRRNDLPRRGVVLAHHRFEFVPVQRRVSGENICVLSQVFICVDVEEDGKRGEGYPRRER